MIKNICDSKTKYTYKALIILMSAILVTIVLWVSCVDVWASDTNYDVQNVVVETVPIGEDEVECVERQNDVISTGELEETDLDIKNFIVEVQEVNQEVEEIVVRTTPIEIQFEEDGIEEESDECSEDDESDDSGNSDESILDNIDKIKIYSRNSVSYNSAEIDSDTEEEPHIQLMLMPYVYGNQICSNEIVIKNLDENDRDVTLKNVMVRVNRENVIDTDVEKSCELNVNIFQDENDEPAVYTVSENKILEDIDIHLEGDASSKNEAVISFTGWLSRGSEEYWQENDISIKLSFEYEEIADTNISENSKVDKTEGIKRVEIVTDNGMINSYKVINVVVPMNIVMGLNPEQMEITMSDGTIRDEQIISQNLGIMNLSTMDVRLEVGITVEDKNGIIHMVNSQEEMDTIKSGFLDTPERAENDVETDKSDYDINDDASIYLEIAPSNEEGVARLNDGSEISQDTTSGQMCDVKMTASEYGVSVGAGEKLTFILQASKWNLKEGEKLYPTDRDPINKLERKGLNTNSISGFTLRGTMNEYCNRWSRLTKPFRVMPVYNISYIKGDEDILEGTNACVNSLNE